MKITIVNGTNRVGSKTINISRKLKELIQAENIDVKLIDLENFKTLFTGEYLNEENTKGKLALDIKAFKEADLIIFVVPIYHHSLTSAIKNSLDILDVNLYNNKVFGFISANETQDLGAREVKNNVDGIIAYKKHESITISRIEMIDYENINVERLKNYFNYCLRLAQLFNTRRLDSEETARD